MQENIDNKQAIVVGKDLTLSSAHGNVANEANALLWAAGELTVKAQNITNKRAALIEAGGNARLTAAVALLNKLGRIRAGEDMHLDAPRIENTAKLSGEVQRKGVQDVGEASTAAGAVSAMSTTGCAPAMGRRREPSPRRGMAVI